MRPSPSGIADVPAAIADLSAQAIEHAPDFGRQLWEKATQAIPEAGGWEASLVAAGPASAEAVIRELAGNLGLDRPPEHLRAAPLALAHARQFAREEIPLAIVLRIYQLGHELWRDFYVDVLAAHVRTPEELVEVAGIVSAKTFAFLHQATLEVVAAYEEERVRLQDSGERARRRTVDAILAGEPVDPALATTRLGIDLRRSHTALVAWADEPVDGEDPTAGLQRLLRSAAAAVGIERPLIVSLGWTTAVAWLTRAAPEREPLPRRLAAAGLDLRGHALAVGCEAPGIEGFRVSHGEALAARPFARPGAALVTYEDVELASLLVAEPARARTFARRELRGLAANDEPTRRLRETLVAHLAAGSSATRTAERLGVHKNTVIYRVRQAEAVRGAPVSHRRLELEAALRIAEAMPRLLVD